MPNTSRPSVTWKGAKPSVPTLMNRKLKPQTSERKAKRIRQGTGRARRSRRAGAEEDCEEAVAVLMGVRCPAPTS